MDGSVENPYKFYNNRFLKRDGEQAKIHSGDVNRNPRLFPLRGSTGSDGKYLVPDKQQNYSWKPKSDGYVPAQLSVHDLIPSKQDGEKLKTCSGNVVVVTACDSSVLGEMEINVASQFNPYNKLNQKIHTALWCPVLLFLIFIFCIPAVLHMRESDKAFASQDFKKAKKYGTISTLLYFVGILFGLLFYAFVIFAAIHYGRKYCGY